MNTIDSEPLDGPHTLLQLVRERARQAGHGDAFRFMVATKKEAMSFADWHQRALRWASALVELGLEVGDRVSIQAGSSVQWCVADLGNLMAGAITVPLFQDDIPQRIHRLMKEAQVRVAIVETAAEAAVLWDAREQLSHLKAIVFLQRASETDSEVLDRPTSREWVFSLDELDAMGTRTLGAHEAELGRRGALINADTVAAIAYTPGTEGMPKGVVLTHGNFIAASAMLSEGLGLDATDLQLLYLPFSHVFGRTCLWVSVMSGGTVAFARDYGTFEEDARAFKPTYFCSVPRLFEKLRDELEQEADASSGLEKFVTRWAQEDDEEPGFLAGFKKKVADTFVVNRIKERLGSQIRFAVSGGAHLSPALGTFFERHGMPVLEGYGMSETTAASHINRLSDNRYGTVGQPMAGQDQRFLEDGELVLRGAHLSPGDWQADGSVVSRKDAEGWFATGDVGRLDDDGFLAIVDRKRNIILTATGKVVAPEPISEAIRALPLVEHAVLCGDGRPFISALVWVNREALAVFAAASGIDGDEQFLLRHTLTYEKVEAHIQSVNGTIAPSGRVRKFAIMEARPSIEAGDLTLARRMRRRVVVEKNRAVLDSFYSEDY